MSLSNSTISSENASPASPGNTPNKEYQFGPRKTPKALVLALSFFAIAGIATAAVFAYLYFSNQNNNTLCLDSEKNELAGGDTETVEGLTPTISEVRQLLNEKYKFKEEEGSLCYTKGRISCAIENFDNDSKIQFTILNVDDSLLVEKGYDEAHSTITKNIKYEDLNNQFKHLFGLAEDIDKKNYSFEKNAITGMTYLQEDDSFDIQFLDGLGGATPIMKYNKITGVNNTKDGFSATILTVNYNEAPHSDEPDPLFESSSSGTVAYHIMMSEEDKNTIKGSLSAYRFNFITEDGEHKLTSIEKL